MTNIVPPIRTAAEMLPHSPWAAEVPGLVAQSNRWLAALPVERRRLSAEAGRLATPALHPAGMVPQSSRSKLAAASPARYPVENAACRL